MVIKINLGSGHDYQEGFINIDKDKTVKADHYCDLEDAALPFKDGSVDYILAKHVLEHISNLFGLINECGRVLKSGGILEVRVPHYRHENAFTDPTHIRFFTERTFRMFDRSWVDDMRKHGWDSLNVIPMDYDFKVEIADVIDQALESRYKEHPEKLDWDKLRYNNIIAEVRAKMVKQ